MFKFSVQYIGNARARSCPLSDFKIFVTFCDEDGQRHSLVLCMSISTSGNKYSIGAQSHMYAKPYRIFPECFREVSGLQTQISTGITDPPFSVTILLCIPETAQVIQFTCTYWIPFREYPGSPGGERALFKFKKKIDFNF